MASTTGANNNNKSRPSNSYENNEEAWETELAKANRSALIVIRNLTSESLFRIKFSLIHGMWYVPNTASYNNIAFQDRSI